MAKPLPEIAKLQRDFVQMLTAQATEQTKEIIGLSTRASLQVLAKVQCLVGIMADLYTRWLCIRGDIRVAPLLCRLVQELECHEVFLRRAQKRWSLRNNLPHPPRNTMRW